MNVAFAVVFGVFIALIVGLSIVAVTWAVRRDRAARAGHPRRERARPSGARGMNRRIG